MSFLDHIEQLRWHILRSLLAIFVGTIIAFVKIGYIYDTILMAPSKEHFVTYRFFCNLGHFLGLGDRLCMGDGAELVLQNMKMAGQFMQAFTSASTLGIVIAAPYVLWELWRFIMPALKPNELKYTKGVVFYTSALFFLGIAFGYYVVTPYTVHFFANFSISKSIHNIITIKSYLSMLRQSVLGTGILFELPILTFFLAKVGVVNTTMLKKYHRHAIVGMVILSACMVPNVVTQVILCIPLYGLYALSLFICKRVEKQNMEEEEKWS